MAKRRNSDKSSEETAEDATPAQNEIDTSEQSNSQDVGEDIVEVIDDVAESEEVSEIETTASDTVEGIDDVSDLIVDEDLNLESLEDATIKAAGDDVAATPLTEEEAEKLLEDAETVVASSVEPELKGETEPSPKPIPIPSQSISAAPAEQKSGLGGMILGGVLAAGLGYTIGAVISEDLWPFAGDGDQFEAEMRDSLSTQNGTLSDLTARLDVLEGVEIPEVDLSPLENQLAAVQSAADGLSTRLDDIKARVDTLEKQPMEQAVSPEAIAAYERALADLQADVEAQRAEVVQMAQDAMKAEDNAEENALLAASRTALADITSALETGSGFAEAIGILSESGVDVPEALSGAAESGVATQGRLIADFPAVARASLAAARNNKSNDASGSNKIITFFENQLGSRSLAPKEGDDADAVLSRAEAAVKSGDLGTALTELTGLPDEAQSVLAEWQDRAQKRLDAKTAADTLVQQLLQ